MVRLKLTCWLEHFSIGCPPVMMSYHYHAHKYSNLQHIIFVYTYTYMYISHIHVSTSGKFLLLRNIRGKQMVMCASDHTYLTIDLPQRKTVSKSRGELDRRKWLGDGMLERLLFLQSSWTVSFQVSLSMYLAMKSWWSGLCEGSHLLYNCMCC